MRDNEETEPVGTFEYPTAATTFDLPSPTAPEAPTPDTEEPAESPVKVPLNIPDLTDGDEQPDDEDFIPYDFSTEGAPQKSYYLRELEADESDEERQDDL